MQDKTNTLSNLSGQKIAFVIPGEINEGFLSQIALFDMALRQLPSPLNQARVIAFLGFSDSTEIPQRWKKFLQNVEIRYVKNEPGDGVGFHAQAIERFKLDDNDLEYVIFSDADTLVVNEINQVFSLLSTGIPVAGVIAHYPPPDIRSNPQLWHVISEALIGRKMELTHAYNLMPEGAIQNPPILSPDYFNFGFLPFRMDALREFSSRYIEMRTKVSRHLNQDLDFVGQVSIPLTLCELNWVPAILPLRYNFPNDMRAIELHHYEMYCLRVLHYLRETNFRRSSLLASSENFNAFMGLEITDGDLLLKGVLDKITGGVYPFH